jgi:hypothetical protein
VLNLKGLMKTIGITWEDIREVDRGLLDKAAVSEINGGQFPEVRSPHILPKKGEIVHLECAASLMKEVAVRQYQGGYSGFSFPIGKSRDPLSRRRESWPQCPNRDQARGG